MLIKFALSQVIGGREIQEDTCALVADGVIVVPDDNGGASGSASNDLFAVMCDGMGGHAGGEVASQIAAGVMIEVIQQRAYASHNLSQQLKQACLAANNAIAMEVHGQSELEGMGTTIVALRIQNGILNWVSVGDSHLLLLSKREVIKLNQDHSMKPVIERMVDKGIITRDDARNHPDRNALRSVLSGDEFELIDTGAGGWPVRSGDVFILASDGLDVVPLREINKAFGKWRKPDLLSVARKLVMNACEVGGLHQDNTSIIIIKVA